MPESPSDLAVAFRSFGRRLGEALDPLDGDESAEPVRDLTAQLHQLLASAAAELRVPLSPDVTALGAAIADAIARTPSEAWADGQLDRLRRIALESGGVLRKIDAAARAGAS